jgi:hypothetical protein
MIAAIFNAAAAILALAVLKPMRRTLSDKSGVAAAAE